jgi:hypothetical protein
MQAGYSWEKDRRPQHVKTVVDSEEIESLRYSNFLNDRQTRTGGI